MRRIEPWFEIDQLRAALAQMDGDGTPAGELHQLISLGLDRPPPPGDGGTLIRWQALVSVAQHDLSLAKLYEGHTDALAILQELRHIDLAPEGTVWGTWAAEPPGQRVVAEVSADGRATLKGEKPWCSGAATVSHGLLTAWLTDGSGPQLMAVSMEQPDIQISARHWCAVGMADSASHDVRFDDTEAVCVGRPGDYLARPGFWQGGAGIAACWYGGALTLAEALQRATRMRADPYRLAALGRVDVALQATAAMLREAATWIDNHPTDDASTVALRVRQAAEAAARLTLDEVGRALGATPFCRDARFARTAADLPVYIRQSHAERDFAGLGERLVKSEGFQWSL